MDPITDLRADISPYVYFVNNPLLYIDKFGLDTTKSMATQYLKEVLIIGKKLAVASAIFPFLDQKLKMTNEWLDKRQDKYHAENSLILLTMLPDVMLKRLWLKENC